MSNTSKIESQWILSENNRVKYTQSSLLNHFGFKHYFFGKSDLYNHPRDIANVIDQRNFSIHYAKQIHGNKIIKASRTSLENTEDADGVISDNSKQTLWICTADCIPLLFADKASGLVAATHAGWKGLAKNILHETIKAFISSGSKVENIIVALGPAISLANYEVGSEVIREIFNSTRNHNYRNNLNIDIFIDSLIQKDILDYDPNEKKYRLELRLLAKNQLINNGILPVNISICNLCTFSESNSFHSWRRDHIKAVQWSTIFSQNR